MLKMFCDFCGKPCSFFINVHFTNHIINSITNKVEETSEVFYGEDGYMCPSDSEYNICADCSGILSEIMNDLKEGTEAIYWSDEEKEQFYREWDYSKGIPRYGDKIKWHKSHKKQCL